MSQYKELPQVEFAVAAQNAFKKFFQFKGRIRRSEYWWGFLTLFIAAFVISLVPFVGPLVALVLSIAGISMQFRRLHDTGRSGWWWAAQACVGTISCTLFFVSFNFSAYLEAIRSQDIQAAMNVLISAITSITGILAIVFYLINIALGITILVFLLQDSQPEANKYGESPKYVLQNTEV